MKLIQYLLGVGCVQVYLVVGHSSVCSHANIENNPKATFVAAEIPLVLA